MYSQVVTTILFQIVEIENTRYKHLACLPAIFYLD